MLATGGLLVSIALLTLALVAPVFRSSNPPEWTTRGWTGELVTLVIVCTLALGLGYLGAGAIAAFQAGPDYLDLGLLGVILLVSTVIWRRLSARARPGVADVSGYARVPESGQGLSGAPVPAAEPLPVTASGPPPPPKAA
jgi:hypothetical protein